MWVYLRDEGEMWLAPRVEGGGGRDAVCTPLKSGEMWIAFFGEGEENMAFIP